MFKYILFTITHYAIMTISGHHGHIVIQSTILIDAALHLSRVFQMFFICRSNRWSPASDPCLWLPSGKELYIIRWRVSSTFLGDTPLCDI